MTAATTTTNWHGPCEAQLDATDPTHPHASWDLDLGDAMAWMRAAEQCRTCPLLLQCRDLRGEYYGAASPAGVIWAGVAYSETGRPLDAAGLRRLAAVRRNRQTKQARRAARRIAA